MTYKHKQVELESAPVEASLLKGGGGLFVQAGHINSNEASCKKAPSSNYLAVIVSSLPPL